MVQVDLNKKMYTGVGTEGITDISSILKKRLDNRLIRSYGRLMNGQVVKRPGGCFTRQTEAAIEQAR